MGSPDQGAAAKRLLCKRLAQRAGGRYARFVRNLLWHYGRPGVCLDRFGRQLETHRAGPAESIVRGSADPAMIRVILPQHLRTLAQVGQEVELGLEGDQTIRSTLDALIMENPSLRGTILDKINGQPRPYIRFFACGEDLSLDPPDSLLPVAVLAGTQPFRIVGAMAGG